MSVSHSTFCVLPFEQQVQWVWNEGHHLATRYKEEDTIGLYHMEGGFFVELYYDHVANQIVERTRTFTSRVCLEDYAHYIRLVDLPYQ